MGGALAPTAAVPADPVGPVVRAVHAARRARADRARGGTRDPLAPAGVVRVGARGSVRRRARCRPRTRPDLHGIYEVVVAVAAVAAAAAVAASVAASVAVAAECTSPLEDADASYCNVCCHRRLQRPVVVVDCLRSSVVGRTVPGPWRGETSCEGGWGVAEAVH